MNSIRDNLTKEEIISDIRLSLSHDIMHERTFLVVEGKDDLKFWKKFKSNKVTVFESFSGKNGIKEIVVDIFHNNKRVVGIRDRDYDSISASENVLYYDLCCLEIMMISNDKVVKEILNEYYLGELNLRELIELLLKQLKYISLMRRFSSRENLKLKFTGISLNNAFDKENKKIIYDELLNQINKQNKDYFNKNIDKLQEFNDEIREELSSEQLLNITQGHDFLTLFAIHCNLYTNKDINDTNLSSSLRCSYRKDEFAETNLYSKIKKYELDNNLEIIL